mmetsp:Transcript_34636/g.99530  ORF Transcript_34636/g.99530 Transcript_34636/m.99530 type:complete len:147 (-) Transcript_34636:219-659(-)
MGGHQVFQEFPPPGLPTVRPVRGGLGEPAGKSSCISLPRAGGYDFRAWGVGRSAKELRGGKADGVYWRRTIAPGVVERVPRARSISNFPGFDPSRDRNYFDRGRPWTGSPLLARSGAAEVQTLRLDPLPAPPRTSSTQRTGSSHRA